MNKKIEKKTQILNVSKQEPNVQQFAAEIDFELWKKLKKYLIDVNLNHRQFLEQIIKNSPD